MAWKPIPNAIFHSAPAAVCTPDGNDWAVFAQAADKFFYISSSTNEGETWTLWRQVENGAFVSSPAASIAADGRRITVYGIGENLNVYFIKSAGFGIS